MTATDERLGQSELETEKAEADDLTLWSVTTIIGALDKPALLYWAAEQTAEAAIDSERTWKAMLADRGRGEAVKWLRDARFRRPRNRLSATDLGTAMHACAEEYALTGVRPDLGQIAEIIRQTGGPDVDIRAEGPVLAAMVE